MDDSRATCLDKCLVKLFVTGVQDVVGASRAGIGGLGSLISQADRSLRERSAEALAGLGKRSPALAPWAQ